MSKSGKINSRAVSAATSSSASSTSVENMNSLPLPVKQYLMYLLTIKGNAKLTVSEYIFDLRLFCRFMKQYKEAIIDTPFDEIDVRMLDVAFFKDISKEDIFAFLYYISEQRDNENASRARKLSAVRGFFRYLHQQVNKIDFNPAENISAPKLKQSLPKFLSLDESVMLLGTIGEDYGNHNRTRDYCIITLFLNCGMRLSELVGINLTDISKDLSAVRILGKRNKERFVYFNDACKEALAEYLELRNSLGLESEKALFISRHSKRLCRSTVQKMVGAYFKKAGLADKNYSTHKLRHTAATLMYQYGNVDTKILQEILGHTNLNTTQIYTHVASSQLMDAMKKSPLSKISANTDDDL